MKLDKKKATLIGLGAIALALLYLLLRQSGIENPVIVGGGADNFTGNVPDLAFPDANLTPYQYVGGPGYNPNNNPLIPNPKALGNACCDKCAKDTDGVFTMGILTQALQPSYTSFEIQRQVDRLFQAAPQTVRQFLF